MEVSNSCFVDDSLVFMKGKRVLGYLSYILAVLEIILGKIIN